MRSAYVLLGLVTLTSLRNASGVCSNGLAGLPDGDVCCEDQCESCGGYGCDLRPGGSENCCYGVIKDSGVMCSTASEAPCIIDACTNGVPGVQDGDVCCEGQCGTCGGYGCDLRPGGSDACCYGVIKDSGVMCSTTSDAPCIIDPVCTNGVTGVQDGKVCCESQCGSCGGYGCNLRPGGPEACCFGVINSSGVMCSTTSEAPCIIDGYAEES